ncbi:MAG: lipoate--protein ligase family protein [Candidatus Aceula meridiana]|nr:lipoate--protein ligase family protein [Candidatus Aceula meridiana]
MICKNIFLSTPKENLYLDDALLKIAEENNGPEVLRFWESSSIFIVLGKTSKAQDDVFLTKAKEDNVPILRRSSGGGTVIQGPGCLNYSLIISKTSDRALQEIPASYSFISTKVISGLRLLCVNAEFFPPSDIALAENQKKFSGNAQKRGRNFILHHGTILYNFDLSLVEKYLPIPQKFPEYRRERGHRDFLTNISLNRKDIEQGIAQGFDITVFKEAMSEKERKCLAEILSK